MRFYFTFFLLFLGCGFLSGQDSLKVKLEKEWSPGMHYNSFMLANPAIRSSYELPCYSELSAGYNLSDGKAVIQQEGTRDKRAALSVWTSQIVGQGKRIWGNVTYRNGQKDGVRWNESSDYALVYPYVMADTVGQRNLQYEKYAFSGGYSQLTGRIGYGLQMDYSASRAYRTIDPRPDNTVSDLFFRLGLTYALNSKYTLGLGGFWRKYKQDNSIKFRSATGIPKVYHASGLGTDMYLFSGKAKAYNTLYDGSGYEVNIQLFPIHNKGWGIYAAYSNFSYDKELNDLLYLPVSSVEHNGYKLLVTYQKGDDRHWKGMRLALDHQKRKGKENRFYVPQTDIYEKIATADLYAHALYSGMVSFSYGITGRTSWVFTPFASITRSEEQYKEPVREISYTNLTYGLQAKALLKRKRVWIDPEMKVFFRTNTNKKWLMTDLSKDRYVYDVYEDNYRYYTKNAIALHASVRGDYFLSAKYALFIKVAEEYTVYSKAFHRFNLSIACGLVF